MDIGDPRGALAALIARHQESYAGLSRLLGRNDAYVQQFVQRGSPRRLAEADRKLLAAYFGVDEAVLGGPCAVEAAIARVPRLDVGLSAGPGGLADGDRVLSGEAIDPRVLRRLGVRAADLSLVMATGDSMTPTIADGDEMLVDHADCTVPAKGAIFAIRRAGLVLVKRLVRQHGALSVVSDNPAYPPFDAADVEIIGRVVRLSRTLK